MMKVWHGGRSGHSASVLMMLAEKGLDYESHPVDLHAYEQHGRAFLAINPAGQLPVLEDDGRRLTETFFTLLYLDERYPDPPLGGSDAKARYIAQKWGKYVETHIAPNLALYAWSTGGTAPDEVTRAGFECLTPERRALWQQAATGFPQAEIESARAAIAKAMDRLAEELAAGPWLAGPSYGIADIAVYPHIVRARQQGFDMPTAVAAWLDRVAARPRVREALGGPTRELITMGPERGRWG